MGEKMEARNEEKAGLKQNIHRREVSDTLINYELFSHKGERCVLSNEWR